MDITELKKLIPFYVAGSLDPEERSMVEKALRESNELQTELEFWTHARAAVGRHVRFRQEGHLSPEQILSLIELDLHEEPETSYAILNHLQKCDSCSQQVEIIRSTYPTTHVDRTPGDTRIEAPRAHARILSVKQSKVAYIVAIAAVIIIACMIFFSNTTNNHKPQNASPVYANLFLSYASQLRGGEITESPVLLLDHNATHIVLTISLPAASSDSIRYAVSVVSPSGEVVVNSQLVIPSRFNETLDTLRVVIHRQQLASLEGEFQILVTEVLPPAQNDLTPETYEYQFRVHQNQQH